MSGQFDKLSITQTNKMPKSNFRKVQSSNLKPSFNMSDSIVVKFIEQGYACISLK
jgi:hypothetical protein